MVIDRPGGKKKALAFFPAVKKVVFNNPFYHRTSKILEAYVVISKYNDEVVFQLSSPICGLFHP